MLEYIQFVLETIANFLKHGWNPALAFMTLVGLLRIRAIRKKLNERFPWLKGGDSEQCYVANQERIESKIDALLAERGIEWESNLPPPISKQAKTQHIRSYYSYSHKVIQWGNQLERMINMKKWIRPDKLAVIFGVLTTAANEFLGTGIDSGNIVAFFIIMFTYLKSNEIINITRYAHGLPVEFKVNSSKLWFTLIGMALTFYAAYTGEALSQEAIYSIAGIISGYNVYEGKKDVQEAQKEAEGNHYR